MAGGHRVSEGFIKAVSPQAAVISVGRYNPYNHPNPETLERYNAGRRKNLQNGY